jgi:arabinofuranosyltransferase
MNERLNLERLLKIGFFAFFFILLIRNAWISQRAYLNFRVIENVVQGYGLGVNPGERVLPFGSPLWPMLLAGIYSITEKVFNLPWQNQLYTLTLIFNIFCSLVVTLMILQSQAKPNFSLIIMLLPLLLSKAYIDYSTSGLETSLVYLLIIVTFFLYLGMSEEPSKRNLSRVVIIYIVSTIVMMVQWEVAIFTGSLIFWMAVRYRHIPRMRWIWLIPVILVLIYTVMVTYLYGSPFSNMYISRFAAGVGIGRLIRQGMMYILHTVDFDPISILAILAACFSVIYLRRRELYPFVFGIVGTIGLIICIGGDSMGGRLLAPLVLVSTVLLGQLDLEPSPEALMSLLVISAVGILLPRSPVLSTYNYEYAVKDHRGILDARGSDYPRTGLLRFSRISAIPPLSDWSGDDWVFNEYDKVLIVDQGRLGFQAYAAGPNIYILAKNGLTDPLMSRLPSKDHVVWDIDTLERSIPVGYEGSILSVSNDLVCPSMMMYYDQLKNVVSGELSSRSRVNLITNLTFSRGIYARIPSCE